MLLSDAFGVITLLILLSLTGFSYYSEKFRLVERILACRYPRFALQGMVAAGFCAGAVLVFFNYYLAAIVCYLSLLTWLVVKTGNQYRWMPNVIKTGVIFTIVYLILKYAENLSWWQWIRLRP